MYYLDLFEMHYQPEPTLHTADDPTSASFELSMPPSSSSTLPDNRLFMVPVLRISHARITCGCTKAK